MGNIIALFSYFIKGFGCFTILADFPVLSRTIWTNQYQTITGNIGAIFEVAGLAFAMHTYTNIHRFFRKTMIGKTAGGKEPSGKLIDSRFALP